MLSTLSELTAFLDASPTPYHAVAASVDRLAAAGFTELFEDRPWEQASSGRHFVRRGGSIIAWVVGTDAPADAGVRIIGAHTDSPNLRLKPNAVTCSKGFVRLGAEVYGGVLLSTWMDRDLGLAGQVVVRGSAGMTTHLYRSRGAIARIPNLAIHLNRAVNREGLILNEQKHMIPLVGLGAAWDLRAHLATELGVATSEIADFDLGLFDHQGAAVIGDKKEFIVSGRLDNLASCFAALSAVIQTADRPGPMRMVVLYDHEEVGSRSFAGAHGAFLASTLERAIAAHPAGEPDAIHRSLSRGIMLSADMAHGVHPNYSELHEPAHEPHLGAGLVIKHNAGQSYATEPLGSSWVDAHCLAAGRPAQRFVVKSDLPCGSTVGPITAARIGIRTVDVGAPMLSMHSAREMAATADILSSAKVFESALVGGDAPWCTR